MAVFREERLAIRRWIPAVHPQGVAAASLSKGMKQMAIQSLGPRIREARRAAGLSGVALAKLIDRSQPYVSDLERGQRTPSLETLYSLAAALGRPVSYFLGEDQPPARRVGKELPATSGSLEVRQRLAELVAAQLAATSWVQGDDAPDEKQMVRVVEQAIDNAYHQLHRALRQQRQKQQTEVG